VSNVYDAGRRGFNKGGIGIGIDGERIPLRTLDSFDLPGLDYLKLAAQ